MAQFVLYNIETTRLVKPRSGYSAFTSAAAAKAARTRAGLNPAEYAITEYENFCRNVEKKEVRVNLMSGVEFTTSVNAIRSVCPSSETYWAA
jgi:hypothetical protein